MYFDTIQMFPTTAYIGELSNHVEHKNNFYKIYPKYDYEETEYVNTVSEECGNPFIHLEPTLENLFQDISLHIKNYAYNILCLKDIFDVTITKTWLSRTRKAEYHIPYHIHSTSHISFVYYVNMPPNSHALKFLNKHEPNALFDGLFTEIKNKDNNLIEAYNEHNCQSYTVTPKEGHVLIFPSKIPHSTATIDPEFTGERLAIVGDCSLILRDDELTYSMGYINERYWKKF